MVADAVSTPKDTPPKAPLSHAEAARINAARAWRDNQTGAVYDDPAACVNGCTLLTGEAAIKALEDGTAPAAPSNDPVSPEAQEQAEIKRREDADVAKRKADAEAEAKRKEDEAAAKAAPKTADKARKRGSTK